MWRRRAGGVGGGVGGVALLALVSASGCVTSAPRRTTPKIVDNGAALEVRVAKDPRWDAVRKRSSDGGKEESFRGFFQGDTPIVDELDFYAVANDGKHLARVVDWREKSSRAYSATIAAQGLGAVVVALGVGAGAYGLFVAPPEPVGTTTFYYEAAVGFVIVGTCIFAAAPSALWSALGPETELDRRLEQTPLVIAWPEAAEVAAEFNRARGREVAPPAAP